MDPFFPMNYVGHQQQSIPQESKLAAYTAGRSPTFGVAAGASSSSANHLAQNSLAQNLASLSLSDGNQTSITASGASSTDIPLFSKANNSFTPRENVSPTTTTTTSTTTTSGTGNGSQPTSRNTTPVPPVTYQIDGGTTYYYAEDSQQEIQDDANGPQVFPAYSVYTGTPSHLKDYMTRIASVGPAANPVVHPNTQNNSFFAPEEIKLELMHKNAVTLSQANPQMFPDLPAQIDHYHEICPLEPQAVKSVTFGYPNSVYKAINSKNGFTYCLRRIHGFRLPSGKWLGLVEAWKQISHCNLVQLREIFTTKAFGDSSLIFVYDYFASADTLMIRHFDRNQVNGYVDPFNTDPSVPRPYSHQKNALLRHHANMLPENLLWAYIVQLSSVIRTIHTAGLAVRSLDPTKILVTSRTRPSIRLNCCGIYDIITFDPSASPVQLAPFYQQEDLLALGKLILALACNSLLAVQRENLSTSLELISRTYSSDLRNLIVYLMNPRGTGNRSINDIMPMIGARFYNQLDSSNARAELLENCLAREIENGRLFRLIVKLCTVVERNELNMDPTWSETGDRYLLKLFRDYVFHQVTSDGRPWLDLSHVVYCLNRLDTGSMEKICLMSRDEQSILITTYAELKNCMELSFSEILACAASPNTKQNQLSQMASSPVSPSSQSHPVSQ